MRGQILPEKRSGAACADECEKRSPKTRWQVKTLRKHGLCRPSVLSKMQRDEEKSPVSADLVRCLTNAFRQPQRQKGEHILRKHQA